MALGFEKCVGDNKLVKVEEDKQIAQSEIMEGEHDLQSALDDLKHRDWKWSTDKAYYAMFHAARGLLFMKGYKEKSHTCLILAIHELFVKEGLLEERFLDLLISGKKRREDAIYESKYSEEIARTHVDAAREFLTWAGHFVRKW